MLSEEDVPGAHFSRDPAEYSVLELKRWLECHGEKKSGRKQELIDRTRSCIALKKGIDPKVDLGKWYNQKRQGKERRSSTRPRNIDIPVEGWGNFPTTDIPGMFNYGHVYQYLIESVAQFGQTGLGSQNASSDSEDDDRDFPQDSGYTSTARPLRNGMNLMKSGFVNDVLDHTNDNYYFCKAHVHHSMKNELPLAVVVVLSHKSGSVQQATCTCKASAFGRCAHVSALLLKIVNFIEVNGTKVKAPSTSKPCQWNRGKKRAKDPTVVHSATYESKKAPKLKLYDWDPRPIRFQNNFGNELANSFLRNLQAYSSKTNEVSMWELSLRMKYEDYPLQEERKAILKTLVNDLEKSLKDVFTGMDQVEYTEIPGTIEQSASLRWSEERRFRITASKCKTAYSCGEKLLCEKGQECLGQFYNWIQNNFWFPKHITTKDIEYGIEKEAAARAAYEAVTGTCVSESGIWVCNRFPYLGASPDGLIKDANAKTIGVIEIKCLKIFKEKSIQEVVEEYKQKTLSSTLYNRQCFKIEDDNLLLRESHSYYYQIQLQLLVTGCHFCDFVLYSAKGPPSIQRINENKTFQYHMVQALSAFWHRVLIPDFFEMRVPRELQPFILP